MSDDSDNPRLAPDAWKALWGPLRALTSARIGLPRSGASLGTSALLDFRLAHARAKDAVDVPLAAEDLAAALRTLDVDTVMCESRAADHETYLMRPDLGRLLDEPSADRLGRCAAGRDLSVVVADGLSAAAVQQHAAPLLRALLPGLRAASWSLAPIAILRHGRVAAGDAIGTALAARCVLVLIGERPGLSSPDSMSAYVTWAPAAGRSDADRNCVSNIRPAGFTPRAAAAKLAYLLERMRTEGVSGVALKDDMREAPPDSIADAP